MIRILHVMPTLGVGGIELTLARLIRGLGPPFAHAVACLTGRPAVEAELGPAVPVHALHGETDAMGQLWRLRRLIATLRPAVVHARNVSAWVDTAAVRLMVLRRPPLVLSFHGTDHAGPLSRRARTTASIAARSATRVFTVSQASRTLLAESLGLAPDRIDVIPNGVDLERFVPGPDPARPGRPIVVGTVGNLSPVKNQRVLVRACAELVASGHAVELRIAGEGPERPGLRELAQSLGIGDAVRFPGHVADVPSFLRSLDLFVLPSDSEAHPNALIEAMACGLPCIASRVGGIPEVLPDDGVGRLFDRGDTAGLVKIMAELSAEPDTRAALGRRARRRVEDHYGVDAMIRRYAALYSEVAAR